MKVAKTKVCKQLVALANPYNLPLYHVKRVYEQLATMRSVGFKLNKKQLQYVADIDALRQLNPLDVVRCI